MFFTLFGFFLRGDGGGVGLPRGVGGGHNLLMQFPNLRSSKMEIPETVFFCMLSIQHDQISYGKHVLDPIYVFFAIFGFFFAGGGGWGPQGGWGTAYRVFPPLLCSSKMEITSKRGC